MIKSSEATVSRAIMAYNNLTNPNFISLGNGWSSGRATTAAFCTVQPGDTCLASRYALIRP
jgi:hypothetical protein